jgi:hypothetical protein
MAREPQPRAPGKEDMKNGLNIGYRPAPAKALAAALVWACLSTAAGAHDRPAADSGKAGAKDCICTTQLYYNFCVSVQGRDGDTLTLVRTASGVVDTLIIPGENPGRNCFAERKGTTSLQVYRAGMLVKDTAGIAVGIFECCHAEPKKISLRIPMQMPTITIVLDSAAWGKRDSIAVDSTSVTRWRNDTLVAKQTFTRTRAYRKLAARLARIPAGEYSPGPVGDSPKQVYSVRVRAGSKSIVCHNCRKVRDNQGQRIRNLVREARSLLR